MACWSPANSGSTASTNGSKRQQELDRSPAAGGDVVLPVAHRRRRETKRHGRPRPHDVARRQAPPIIRAPSTPAFGQRPSSTARVPNGPAAEPRRPAGRPPFGPRSVTVPTRPRRRPPSPKPVGRKPQGRDAARREGSSRKAAGGSGTRHARSATAGLAVAADRRTTSRAVAGARCWSSTDRSGSVVRPPAQPAEAEDPRRHACFVVAPGIGSLCSWSCSPCLRADRRPARRLQVLHASRYVAYGDRQRLRTVELPAARARCSIATAGPWRMSIPQRSIFADPDPRHSTRPRSPPTRPPAPPQAKSLALGTSGRRDGSPCSRTRCPIRSRPSDREAAPAGHLDLRRVQAVRPRTETSPARCSVR